MLALIDVSLALSVCRASQYGAECFANGNTFSPHNDPVRFWQIKKFSHREGGDLFGSYGWSLEAVLDRVSDCPCLLKVFFALFLH